MCETLIRTFFIVLLGLSCGVCVPVLKQSNLNDTIYGYTNTSREVALQQFNDTDFPHLLKDTQTQDNGIYVYTTGDRLHANMTNEINYNDSENIWTPTQINDTDSTAPSFENQLDKPEIQLPNPTKMQPIHTTEFPLENRTKTARQSDLLSQIKMQFILDCALKNTQQQSALETVTPTKKKKRPKTTKAPMTTTVQKQLFETMIFSTPSPSTIPPTRRAKVNNDVEPTFFDSMDGFFYYLYEYFEETFLPREVETESSNAQPTVAPPKTVTEVYHFYPTTESSLATTRRLRNNRVDPVVSPPTIIYAMPPPYPGYPSYSYPEPAQQQDIIYRTKRTTLTPMGYQTVVHVPENAQQSITTNNKKKNYMSTQIHVTSEYNPGPTASLEAIEATQIHRRKNKEDDSSSEEEEYGFEMDSLNIDDGGDDDEDDDDDDDDDGDDNEDDDNDDDDDDTNESAIVGGGNNHRDDLDDIDDGFADDYSVPVHRRKQKRRKVPLKYPTYHNDPLVDYPDYPQPANRPMPIRRRPKKPKRKPDDDDYSYEDRDGSSVDTDESPQGFFGNMFGDFFSPISWIWPSSSWSPFRMFSSSPSATDQPPATDDDWRESRSSTTPRNEVRKPKQPSSIVFSEFSVNDLEASASEGDGNWWFSPFSGGDVNPSEVPTTDVTPMTTTESSAGIWNWFGSDAEKGDNNEDDKADEEATTIVDNGSTGWSWFGLFPGTSTAAPTTTTTQRPFISVSNPLQNPQAWLSIMAEHLATTKKPSTSVLLNEKKTYTNHQLWRLKPTTEEQLQFLTEYRSTPEGAGLQWWRGPSLRGPTDIIVPPALVADVKESLSYEDVPYDVIMWDLEKAIQYENPTMTRRERIELIQAQGHPLTWYRYHRYAEITRFLEYMHRAHPNTVELIHIGRSFEGRPLIIAKISIDEKLNPNWKSHERKRHQRKQRPAVFIEAGSHAREWIGPASATWIINRLIQNIHGNDSLGETIRSVDWYVLPVLNPDGYEYSHEYNRFWRKTRSKHPDGSGSMFSIAMNWIRKENQGEQIQCFGVDPNRNWAHNWNGKGASQSECSEFYAGPKAFSEPETKSVSTFLIENQHQIKLFLSLHSYGQLLSYPSTTTAAYNSIKPKDDLHDMARVALESLRTNVGTSMRYTVDATNEMLFARSGAADSFAMNEAAIKYAFTLDLRDTGTHGFLLPASNIEAAARDAFEIVRGMIDYM